MDLTKPELQSVLDLNKANLVDQLSLLKIGSDNTIVLATMATIIARINLILMPL